MQQDTTLLRGLMHPLFFTSLVKCRYHGLMKQWVSHKAYLPTAFLPFTTEMTFIQRAINTFGNFFFHRIIKDIFILRKDYEILKKHFPNEEIPDLTNLERKASLSLSFGHPLILDGWRPVAPNQLNWE